MERPAAQREEILRMFDEGHSASQIARTIGDDLTRSAVCGIVYRARAAGAAITRSGQPQHTLARRTSRPAFVPPTWSVKAARARPHAATPDRAAPPPRLTEDGKTIGTLALSSSDCRWPHGDPRAADFHYCAQPKTEGEPYCAYHAARAEKKQPLQENDDED